MKTTDKATLAKALAEAFETDERDQPNEYGTKTFHKLRHGSPEWMRDAIREAHDGGDIFPNDWIYHTCSNMADRLNDTAPDRWEDSIGEWADSEVDVYNVDRARWLASHLAFGGIVDAATEDMGHSDQGIYGDIGFGQYRLCETIANALMNAINEQAVQEDAEADSE